MSYTLNILPMEIDEIEIKEIKKLGFHDWIFQQAELKNIDLHWIEKNLHWIEKEEDNKEVFLND